MSRQKKPRTIREVCEDIHKAYLHWKDMYFNGCSDPSYEDGVNLNLVRNHCVYYQRELEQLCGTDFFKLPDEYYWPIPPEVPQHYMAKDRRLACRNGVFDATARTFAVTW